MPMMGTREYARHRKAAGLAGGSPAAVSKAVIEGRIQRGPDGLIDSTVADIAWQQNTLEYGQTDRARREQKQNPPVQKPKRSVRQEAADRQRELCRGASWLGRQICSTARRLWPPFVREHWPETGESFQLRLIALLCDPLEAWTVKYSAPAYLQAALRGHQGVGFLHGARALASGVCIEARQAWPRLIVCDVFEPKCTDEALDRFCKIHLIALLLVQLEGWIGNHLNPDTLPAIDWAELFGGEAGAAEKQYQALRQDWAT